MQYNAFAAERACPVATLPPAICLPAGVRPRERLRTGRFRILYPFDPNSFLSRKNPVAAVRAFRRAFPPADRSVTLTLRVNGSLPPGAATRALRRAAAGDSRVEIVERTLSRRDALRDLAQHDLLFSTHRAEGFGRNIAEAIALRVSVLATGGSGNADFMDKAELLAFRHVGVARGAYPHAHGFTWSEPLRDAAARSLRKLRRDAERRRPIWFYRRAARQARTHGEVVAGRRYAERLKIIGALAPWPKLTKQPSIAHQRTERRLLSEQR